MRPKVYVNSKVLKHIKAGHLWVFSGALLSGKVNQHIRSIEPGSLVDVYVDKSFVGVGYYNSKTDIAIRLVSFDPVGDSKDDIFMLWKHKVAQAFSLRETFVSGTEKITDVFRVINSEGDFFPGLIVDKYGDNLVVQISTAGIEKHKEQIIKALQEVIEPKSIVIRNDINVRKYEGLVYSEEPEVIGDVLTGNVQVLENGLKFQVDLLKGQKTGFFIDQREKRDFIKHIAGKKSVLNLFSYTGGFGIYAKAGGARRTVNVDSSESALELAKQNYELNGFDVSESNFRQEDIFSEIKNYKSIDEDIVIVDPPALAKRRGKTYEIMKPYINLNSAVFSKVKPGTIVMTCSCSGHLSLEDFKTAIYKSANYSSRKLQLLKTFQHAPDHPINFAMPEIGYLKCLVVKVL